MANGEDKYLAILECLGIFVGLAGCILIHIDHRQPEPYMDEIFHVPQAQKYCDGNFDDWDPMITTLPGLYVTSVAIMQPVSWLFGIKMSVVCSAFWLRSINIIYAVGNVILMFLLMKKIHSKNKVDDAKILLTSVTLGVFPVLYFFTFLYYTDPGSTFFCLLMYLLSLHQLHFLSAICGIFAVFFRQTNIVWVIFCAGLTAGDIITEHTQPEKKEIEDTTKLSFLKHIIQFLSNSIKNNKNGLIILITKLISQLWSYVLVGILFLLFVIVNNGIVVGAKTDHQVCSHFPQIFYFLSVTAGFSFAHIQVKYILNFPKHVFTHLKLYVVCGIISFVFVWKFTYAHRYLLADNRHYTFYVWHKIYLRHICIKYMLIPVYLGAGYIVTNWVSHKNILWKIVYGICVIMQIVPQMLLEFRYFILPYLLLRMNMRISCYWRLLLELILYMTVNVLTLYLFSEKPFVWSSDGSLQRFMW